MEQERKQRRQSHGSAWHWKQTDRWYYTKPGTKKRMPLFDEQGERNRGKANKQAAEVALAKEKVTWEDASAGLRLLAEIAGNCSLASKVCPVGIAILLPDDFKRSLNDHAAGGLCLARKQVVFDVERLAAKGDQVGFWLPMVQAPS